MYPGTYPEFLWHKEHPGGQGLDRAEPPSVHTSRQEARKARGPRDGQSGPDGRCEAKKNVARTPGSSKAAGVQESRELKKRADSEARKKRRAAQARQTEIEALEKQIANRETELREIEQSMAAAGFYEDREAAQPIIDRHQALMWEIGDLMHQWEKLQSTDLAEA